MPVRRRLARLRLTAALAVLGAVAAFPASGAVRFVAAGNRLLASEGVETFQLNGGTHELPHPFDHAIATSSGRWGAAQDATVTGGADGFRVLATGSVSTVAIDDGSFATANSEIFAIYCADGGDPYSVSVTLRPGAGLQSPQATYFYQPYADAQVQPPGPATGPGVEWGVPLVATGDQGDQVLEADGALGAGCGMITIRASGSPAQTPLGGGTSQFEIDLVLGDVDAEPVGACCFGGGASCSEDETESGCAAQGGAYGGDGSECDEVCPEPTDTCDGDTLTWVGGRAGAFGDPQSWEPPQVPVFQEDGACDTAVVEGGRNVTIDLAAAVPARAVGPPVTLDPRGGVVRSAGRLVVRDSQGLRPVGGRLELDALSPALGARSLEVGDGSQLLVAGGTLAARHVALGVDGPGELEVVGPAGGFTTSGRLGLGANGEGGLLVRQGAQVSSAEAVIGELDAPGAAVVQDAGSLWTTGSLAVGLDTDGSLEVRSGARVESEQSFVDFQLEGAEHASATLGEADAQGNRATWSAQSLEVRKLGGVHVEAGGFLDVADHLLLGSGGDGAEDQSLLAVQDGGQLAASSADVRGTLILQRDALALITQRVAVGDAARPTSSGVLLVEGPAAAPQLDGPSDLEIEARAGVALRNGARANLFGGFVVGLDPASDASLRVVAGREGTGEPSVLRATTSAPLFSVVGATSNEPIGVDVPVSGRLLLEGGRIELAGPDHGLRVGRRGLLTGRGGTIAIDPPGRLLNRGFIEGGFTLDGTFEQPPGAMVIGNIRSPSGEIVSRARLDPRAALSPPVVARKKKAPPSFGPIVVTGDAFLDGAVTLQFGNGVAPRMGESFEVLDVRGTLTGSFAEVVIQGLVPGSFAFEPSLVGGKLALVSLTDAEALPAVSVKAKRKLKETAKRGAKIKLKRRGDASQPLVVGYRLRGTAQSGIDYEALPGTLEIPARKKSATIVVRPIADGIVEGSETIEFELVPDESFAPGLVAQASIELVGKDR